MKLKAFSIFASLVVLASYGLLIALCCVGQSNDSLVQWYHIVWCAAVPVLLLQLAVTPKFMNLEEQFSFYGSYHDSFPNQIIHMLFVWPILWSALVFLAYTPALEVGSIEVHLACTVFALVYFVYYIALERPAGVLAAAMVLGCYVSAEWLAQQQSQTVLIAAAIVHAVSWVAQILGHAIFEGCAPAFIDNLAQSFFMAPLFVLLEGLFLCGYRREFQEQVKNKVKLNIQAFNKNTALADSEL